MTHTFRTAAVIGAGTIGLSWTALFAAHGLTVRVSDPRPDLADAVDEALTAFGPHLAAQGLDVDGVADRVHLTADVTEAVREADVVQENGPERVEFKRQLFAQLVREAPRHALLLVTPEDLDTVVTRSLGIRWATTGPFLSSHLGGGPGGYRHLMAHIGSALGRMQLGEPSQHPDDLERVIQTVEKAYASTPYADLAEARDRGQLAVMTALENTRPPKGN